MVSVGRLPFAAAVLASALAAATAQADTTTTEDVDGIRWEVTRRTMQVPVTQVSNQTQTVMRQQVTTQTVQHQQLYTVPVTQYQLVSTLHGRWNPFVTPYWTHQYQPVTTWQQQTATVQIPVNTVAWAPETRTVQAPTTTYKTVEAIVSRRPLYALPGAAGAPGGSQQMLATGSTPPSGPTATLAARPTPNAGTAAAPSTAQGSVPSVASAPITYGGTQMTSDPPRQPTGGWQAPTDRYNTGGRY